MPKALLFGGSGYVGCNLKCALSIKYEVCVFDINPFPKSENANVKFIKGDITDIASVTEAILLFKPDIVINLASWGMSGSAMINEETKMINTTGARAVIDACCKGNCPRLIYTSTYNVVFGGQEVVGGDETIQLYPLEKHTDCYSASKAEAETMVINANNCKLDNGGRLLTSSIRPAAIYGEGEQRHFPRIVGHIDRGIYAFQIGNSTTDWVYIDNLTQAFCLTVDRMMSLTDPTCAPAGQAYFINDGTPIRNADFLAPLVGARDATPPTTVLPVNIALAFAYACEKLYHISSKIGLPIEPFLTRAEVYKVGVTHYFSIAKARRDLGYNPTVTSLEGAQRMAQYYRDRPSNANYFRIPGLIWWVAVLGGLTNHAYFTFYVGGNNPEPGALVSFLDRGILTLFRSRSVLKHIWNWAIGAHIAEGIAATVIARRMGCSLGTTALWGLQTLTLGYPSFRLLLRRRAIYPGPNAANKSAKDD